MQISQESFRKARRRSLTFSASVQGLAAAAASNCLSYVMQDCFSPKLGAFILIELVLLTSSLN